MPVCIINIPSTATNVTFFFKLHTTYFEYGDVFSPKGEVIYFMNTARQKIVKMFTTVEICEYLYCFKHVRYCVKIFI